MMERLARLFPVPIVQVDEDGEPMPVTLVPPWKAIALEVGKKHGFSLAELKSARRDRVLVAARHEAFYRVAKETSLSLPAIGKMFGGKDHTTILHGIRQHAKKLVIAVDN
jgi:chromosomal replication initiation ATPase DnaA